MEVVDHEHFRLSTGRVFYAYGNTLGLNADKPTLCAYGHDGHVRESYPEYPDPFTPEERIEIARYMIALWEKFMDGGGKLNAEID